MEELRGCDLEQTEVEVSIERGRAILDGPKPTGSAEEREPEPDTGAPATGRP